MNTYRQNIREWLANRPRYVVTHMIVAVGDRDYPVFVEPGSSVKETIKLLETNRGTRVREVYDFSLDLEGQINGGNVWNDTEWPEEATPAPPEVSNAGGAPDERAEKPVDAPAELKVGDIVVDRERFHGRGTIYETRPPNLYLVHFLSGAEIWLHGPCLRLAMPGKPPPAPAPAPELVLLSVAAAKQGFSHAVRWLNYKGEQMGERVDSNTLEAAVAMARERLKDFKETLIEHVTGTVQLQFERSRRTEGGDWWVARWYHNAGVLYTSPISMTAEEALAAARQYLQRFNALGGNYEVKQRPILVRLTNHGRMCLGVVILGGDELYFSRMGHETFESVESEIRDWLKKNPEFVWVKPEPASDAAIVRELNSTMNNGMGAERFVKFVAQKLVDENTHASRRLVMCQQALLRAQEEEKRASRALMEELLKDFKKEGA